METLNLGIDGLDQIELIGRGGSSRVYRARQVDLDRLVGLKVLNSSEDSDVLRRFDRERKAMGRLSLNEGIVPIYSTGVTPAGEPYLIMPYYADGSLQDRLERGPVPWREAVEYMIVVANTLAEAHKSGVVHLDLKPANILLATSGAPRIADFGIAKLTSEQGTKNTGAAFTPTFSAPEALLGEPTSPASDVYGLGATLWALIAGRPPFRDLSGDNTLMAVVGRVVHQPVPDLRHLAPAAVCSVIETAMAKQQTDRYATAGAFAQALEAAARDSARTKAAPGRPLGSAPVGNEDPTVVTGAALVPDARPLAHRPPTSAELNALFPNQRRPPEGLSGNGTGSANGIQDTGIGFRSAGGHEPAGRAQRTGLRFDEAVPPPFVPAPAGTYERPDPSRSSMLVLAGGAIVVLIVAVLTAIALGGGGDDTASTTTVPPTAPATSDPTNLGGSVAGPTTNSLVATTSSTAPTTSQPATTSAESIPATTSTTEASTSSATPTTKDPTSTTKGTPSTTPTSVTVVTTVTEPTTNTTGSTSSSSSSSTPTTSPAPDPPTDVVATLHTGSSIVVSWTAPADTTGIEGYEVIRTDTTGLLAVRRPNQLSYTDTQVVAGETYVYRVRTVGPDANSVYRSSNEITVPAN